MHEVHASVVVVVVEGALGLVDGQHLVVDAQPVALRVCVAEHSRLQQLVIAEGNACRGEDSTELNAYDIMSTAAASSSELTTGMVTTGLVANSMATRPVLEITSSRCW